MEILISFSPSTVGLYGPTNFSPVINHVAQFAKSHQDGNNYFVLLIITDGIITGKTELYILCHSSLVLSNSLHYTIFSIFCLVKINSGK